MQHKMPLLWEHEVRLHRRASGYWLNPDPLLLGLILGQQLGLIPPSWLNLGALMFDRILAPVEL